MILAGDIGGTKTTLALFEVEDGKLLAVDERDFESRKRESLESIVLDFLENAPEKPRRACFGVAGPVVDGSVMPTNLPWRIEASWIRQTLGLESVELRNDLETNAYGISQLSAGDLTALNRGAGKRGNAALIAAGTGLGEAVLFRNGDRMVPCASEGGHVDFAPRNDLEIELFRYLARLYGRVSYERVVSGPGLWNIYSFLRDSRFAEEPEWLRAELRGEDRSAVISRVAMEGRSPLCVKALDLFASLYGAEAGNLALKALATGGLYVGGGIAPKILGKLLDGAFLTAFFDKGRLRSLMEDIPVHVIRNRRAALIGAAALAAGL